MISEGRAAFRAPGEFRRDYRSTILAIYWLGSYDRIGRPIGGLAECLPERDKHVAAMSTAHGISPQDSFWPQYGQVLQSL